MRISRWLRNLASSGRITNEVPGITPPSGRTANDICVAVRGGYLRGLHAETMPPEEIGVHTSGSPPKTWKQISEDEQADIDFWEKFLTDKNVEYVRTEKARTGERDA
jgi:hypothetical protein